MSGVRPVAAARASVTARSTPGAGSFPAWPVALVFSEAAEVGPEPESAGIEGAAALSADAGASLRVEKAWGPEVATVLAGALAGPLPSVRPTPEEAVGAEAAGAAPEGREVQQPRKQSVRGCNM